MATISKTVKKYSEPISLPVGTPAIIAAETGYKTTTIRKMLAGYRSRPKKVQDRVAHYQTLLIKK